MEKKAMTLEEKTQKEIRAEERLRNAQADYDKVIREKKEEIRKEEECITKMILQAGEINPDTFDRSLNTIQFYYIALDKLRSSFDVLEVVRGKYITFERFCEKYPEITKDDLRDYGNKAAAYLEKDIYTIHSLRLAGFTHKIDSIKEPEYFFSGLIRSVLNGYFSWTDGKLFFSKCDLNINKCSLLQYIIR